MRQQTAAKLVKLVVFNIDTLDPKEKQSAPVEVQAKQKPAEESVFTWQLEHSECTYSRLGFLCSTGSGTHPSYPVLSESTEILLFL